MFGSTQNDENEEELIFENMERQGSLQEVTLDDDEFWPLRIKCSIRDVRVQVRPNDTVGKVKETVLTALGEPVTRYLRLVCKGRLLTPDQAELKSLNFVHPNDVVHAVLASGVGGGKLNKGGVQAALQHGGGSALSRRALRSAGINASGLAVRRTAAEQEEDDDDEDFIMMDEAAENGRSLRGFDRLRVLGLRRGEIAALRAYFSRHVDSFVAQRVEQGQPIVVEGGEDSSTATDPMLRRQLQEEVWMQSQGPLSEFRLNLPTAGGLALINLLGNANNSNNGGDGANLAWQQNTSIVGGPDREALMWRAAGGVGSTANNNATTPANFGNDRDFICGFLLGFFVGFVMLVWVWMPTVPHKQKLGILTGITVQLALGVLRPQTPNNQDGESDPLHPLHALRHSNYAPLLAPDDMTDDGIVLG